MKRRRTLPLPLQQVDRTYVWFDEAKLSYFGGCDYFRLSSHPLVLKAFREGAKRYGLNVAASRSTTGNHEIYELLEARLAKFFGAPAAVLCSNGYVSNLAVAQALAGTYSHALLDERSHASLVDAAQFLDCPLIRFRHRSAVDVAAVLKRIGPGAKAILLTDGMFSHDGSAAPLKAYLKILDRDALILVDDAHAAGILGKTGQGTIEEAGVGRRQFVQTIALSKAFGVYGGAVLCSDELRHKVQAQSRVFNGNTPLPLPLANAALAAVAILEGSKALRLRLLQNIKRVRFALGELDYPVSDNPSPIIPFLPRRSEEVPRLKQIFIAKGIFPSFIKYSGGPVDGYFRFALSSEHSAAQIKGLIKAFGEIRRLTDA